MADVLHQLLEVSARSRPDVPAVVDQGKTISYEDLDAASNRVARLLGNLGVERGDRVGLYLEKSIQSVIGVYGSLKAGAAYVPLDPHGPLARLAGIAGNCGLRVLLSGAERSQRWAALRAAGAPIEHVVCLDASSRDLPPVEGIRLAGTESVEDLPPAAPRAQSTGDDLAYILYTSGSTGEPKGVMLSHRNALTFVNWAGRTLRLGPHDSLSSHAPLHFDLSVFDLFGAAKAGVPVTLVPREASVLPMELARFIESSGLTVWYSVPSILSMLALRGGLEVGALPNLRAVVFAGEVFPAKNLRRLMTLLPHVEFHNWYGPTETNVCTAYRIPGPPGDDDQVPIGTATDGMEVLVVTDRGARALPGEVGELYVGGTGVMRGYWRDAEGTARVLVGNPVNEASGDPVYRTGDLVRVETDGNLTFVGRRDGQIKSRGYRIELGEIEAAILAHPDVIECAVTAVPDDLVTNRIVAHVVVRGDVDGPGLGRFCRTRIPGYMVPESFELSESLPKTSTGKIDRQAIRDSVAARRAGV